MSMPQQDPRLEVKRMQQTLPFDAKARMDYEKEAKLDKQVVVTQMTDKGAGRLQFTQCR